MLGLYEKSMPGGLSIGEKLEAAKAAGFDYLELSVDETDEKLSRLNWSEDRIQDVLSTSFDVGLPIKSICLSGHRRFPLGHEDAQVQAKSLEIMEKAIIMASKLGVRIIQIAGYDVYYEQSNRQTEENFAKNLALSAKMASKYGVTLAFETMETEFMNTVGKAMRWVNEVKSPFLQVYPDIGNVTNAAKCYGISVDDDLKSGLSHIAAMHMKETVPGVFREVPYGAGHVDFRQAAKIALELGVGMFVAEFWYAGKGNWRKQLQENNAFLRSAIEYNNPD